VHTAFERRREPGSPTRVWASVRAAHRPPTTTTTVQESGLCDACLGGSGGGGELMDKTRRGFIGGRKALLNSNAGSGWLV